MNAAIMIQLPWPPSINHYWRNVVMGKSARVLISKKGRQYREMVQASCMHQDVAGIRIPGRLSVRLLVFPPDRRRRDLDNLPKSLLDSLTHAGVWSDDSQIDRLVIERGSVRKGGAVMVAIEQIPALVAEVA